MVLVGWYSMMLMEETIRKKIKRKNGRNGWHSFK